MPGVVNDLCFSFFFVSFAQRPPETEECPACLGMGAPSITLGQDFAIGSSGTTTVLGRRYHVNDVVSWQKGLHHIRFGGDWETSRGGRTSFGDETGHLELVFSPGRQRLQRPSASGSPDSPAGNLPSLPRLVVNYGLGWTYDAPLNYDLHKPAYLAPVLGAAGLFPTRKNWKQFSPLVGFAWNLRDDGKTGVRGGIFRLV